MLHLSQMVVCPQASQRSFNPLQNQATEEKTLSGDSLVRRLEPEEKLPWAQAVIQSLLQL